MLHFSLVYFYLLLAFLLKKLYHIKEKCKMLQFSLIGGEYVNKKRFIFTEINK